MSREPQEWEADTPVQESGPAADGDDSIFEFETDDATAVRRPRRLRRALWRLLPVLLMTALLVAVAEQPGLAQLLRRSATDTPVQVTVVCDVPWAVIRVDGRGVATHCTEGLAGALPMARLAVKVGQHTLLATAEGFAPYPIYIVAHPNTPGLYLTQFSLTQEGTMHALAAVNDYFASHYTQDALVPVSLWQLLALRTQPVGQSLLLHERFEAALLDSYEPFYSETTYQRPITPAPGSVGVAVVVVEHVTIYDSCGTTPLLERRMPVLYATRASVTFSLHPGPQRWTATLPYALNPTADIYTSPNIAATPATPAALMSLAARTDLADRLGSLSLLAGAVTVTPLANSADWAAGVVLTIINGGHQSPRIPGARPGAVWLYIAGMLISLTSAAHDLSPHAEASTPVLRLDDLRASLANQPARVCGGN